MTPNQRSTMFRPDGLRTVRRRRPPGDERVLACSSLGGVEARLHVTFFSSALGATG
jgi:hypothetical protein